MPETPRRHIRTWLLVVLLAAAQAWLLYMYEAPLTMPKKPVLRIAAPDNEIVKSTLSPYGPGFETDLATAFCEKYGYRVRWTFINSWEEGWELLKTDEVDVLIGAGLKDSPSGGGIPVERGPAYAASNTAILHHESKYDLQSANQLCTNPVLLQNLQMLPDLLKRISGTELCSPQTAVAQGLTLPPVLELMSDLAARFCLVDDRLYELWQPFYPEIRSCEHEKQKLFRRWYWTSRDEEKAQALRDFWHTDARSVSAELGTLYFSFFPKRMDYYEVRYMQNVLKRKLPKYKDLILKAAKRTGIDPLFLAAVIYQESRFNPRARSRTGVRGLMQISLTTADDLGLTNRRDPAQSIDGGSRYLKQLYERLEDAGQDPWDRWFTALAAYNQGMGHTRDAMALAEKLGQDPTRWHNIKKSLKLLSWKKYYRKAKHGYVRGYEAANYVSRIRFYYYVMRGLAVLSGGEFDDLAALAAATPGNWPAI